MTNSSNRGSPIAAGERANEKGLPSPEDLQPMIACPRLGSVFRITAKGGDQDNGTPDKSGGIRRSVSLSFLVSTDSEKPGNESLKRRFDVCEAGPIRGFAPDRNTSVTLFAGATESRIRPA
jgi:hypothetical protein